MTGTLPKMPTLAPWIQGLSSPHTVSLTLDRLEAQIRAQGGTIFARINHSRAAAEAGLILAPTEVMLIGNPSKGTALMQENGAIAMDLPLKFMAFEDENGAVWLLFTNPPVLGAAYGLAHQKERLEAMHAALLQLAEHAVAPLS